MELNIYLASCPSETTNESGWAYVVETNNEVTTCSGTALQSQPVALELLALAEALEYVKETLPSSIVINTRLAAIRYGMTVGIRQWKQTAWRNEIGKPVLHKNLWIGIKNIATSMPISTSLLKVDTVYTIKARAAATIEVNKHIANE